MPSGAKIAIDSVTPTVIELQQIGEPLSCPGPVCCISLFGGQQLRCSQIVCEFLRQHVSPRVVVGDVTNEALVLKNP